MFVITVAGSSASDSSDGFVNVTDTTPQVIAPSGILGIGTLQLVRWNSHSSSYYVDIEYWDTTASIYRPLVTNSAGFREVLLPGSGQDDDQCASTRPIQERGAWRDYDREFHFV